MKEKLVTGISTVMMAVPWTILLIRMNQWALESPAAEIIIYCYMAFMILSGVFTGIFYQKQKIQNNLMKICLVVNGLYTIGGIGIILMTVMTKLA